MKLFIATVAVAIAAFSTSSVDAKPSVTIDVDFKLQPQNQPKAEVAVAGDKCSTCIQTAEQVINKAIGAIINAGVAGTCGKLCNDIENATKSKTIGELCTISCTLFGIKEFIKIIDEADLDPYYFCDLVHFCPINDNGDATITSFTSTPAQGPRGTTFAIEMDFESKNGTGAGSIGIDVKTLDGLPLGGSNYAPPAQPGNYKATFSIKANPDPSCDPTQQQCEQWLPGLYVVEGNICYGECGSKHPHSKVYDQASTKFTIN